MKTKASATICCLLLGMAAPAHAEDVAKRWRLGFGVGAFNPQGEVPSDAANELTVVNDFLVPIAVYTDPRQDSLFFAALEIQPAAIGYLSGQFGITRIFAIEASIGYSAADVGDVEVQVQFDSDVNTSGFGASFRAYRIPVGQLDVVPLQLSGIARFRPQKRFNPYVGAGVGYQFVSLETSAAFDELSANLDASTGIQAEILPATPGIPPSISVPVGAARDLQGAVVNVPDSLTWHLLAGAEYSWSPRWAVTFDLRHMWAEETLTVGFDVGEDLGISVPQSIVSLDSPLVDGTYGPMRVRTGGLIDGGRIVPGRGQPDDTDCVATPTFCVFDPTPDGVPDAGLYYVNGGVIDYRSFSFTVGVRFTFR